MIQVNKELKASFNRLIHNTDFIDFMKALDQSLNEQLRENVRLSGEVGMRGQGRAQELMDIIDNIKVSVQTFEPKEKKERIFV